MNANVLAERIVNVLTTTPLTTVLIADDVRTVEDDDGQIRLEIDKVQTTVYVDGDMANVIAQAVATAVVEFLADSVQVVVPNAAGGGAGLTGYLQ